MEYTQLYLKMAHSARLQFNYTVATKYLKLTEAAITQVSRDTGCYATKAAITQFSRDAGCYTTEAAITQVNRGSHNSG
jgi:hypothetical protein